MRCGGSVARRCAGERGGKLGAGRDAELAVYAREVRFHRLLRKTYGGGHLLVGAAASDDAGDLALAFGEAFEGIASGAGSGGGEPDPAPPQRLCSWTPLPATLLLSLLGSATLVAAR